VVAVYTLKIPTLTSDGTPTYQRGMDEPKVKYARAAGETVKITLRLPEALHAALKADAKRKGISMNLLVVRIVTMVLSGRKEVVIPEWDVFNTVEDLCGN